MAVVAGYNLAAPPPSSYSMAAPMTSFALSPRLMQYPGGVSTTNTGVRVVRSEPAGSGVPSAASTTSLSRAPVASPLTPPSSLQPAGYESRAPGVRRAVSSPSLANVTPARNAAVIATSMAPLPEPAGLPYDGSAYPLLSARPAAALAPSTGPGLQLSGGGSTSAAQLFSSPRVWRNQVQSAREYGAREVQSPREYGEIARLLAPSLGSGGGHHDADMFALTGTDDSAVGNSALVLSTDSPRRRRKALRAESLYADALARRQRQREMKDEADRQKLTDLQQCKLDALLKQRERQRFYRFRDTRTHEEREEALLKRREERRQNWRVEKQRRLEQQEYECTFQPKLFTRREEGGFDRTRTSIKTHQMERSSSCGAMFSRISSQECPTPSSTESPRGWKLQKFLDKQFALIRKMGDIEADAQQARQRKEGRFTQTASGIGLVRPSEGEVREADVQIYKRQFDVVHALERLDIEIMELPKAQQDTLVGMGFRLGLGEGARQGLQSPREAHRKSLAETPRNNLRVVRSAEILSATQEPTNGTPELTLSSYIHRDAECRGAIS